MISMEKKEMFNKYTKEAQFWCWRQYHQLNSDMTRPWLAHNFDSYDDESNRIKVLVWNGSPPKGIITINYPAGKITAMSAFGNTKKWNLWYQRKEPPKREEIKWKIIEKFTK